MVRVREFNMQLNKVTLGEVMNIFCLSEMTDNRHDGILSHYAAGNTSVVSADLTTLESLMMGEDERKKILGLAPKIAPKPTVAQCATDTPKPKKTLHPAHAGDNATPPPTSYPPGKGVIWDTFNYLIDKKVSYITCHSRDKFYYEVGCPVLAQKNLAMNKDVTAVKDILTKYETHKSKWKA